MIYGWISELLVAPAWAQAPSSPVPGAAGGSSPAGLGGSLLSFVPFLLIFVLFYVLMILPQQRRQKKHRAILDALKKGDRVETGGGLLGSVTNIHNDVVTLQVADNVKVKVRRSAITQLLTEEEAGS